jgi:outer membrane lipoprotein SlyB
MCMKLMITIGIFAGGTLGGWIGALMTHGNWLSGWSILLSTVGSFGGIWIGYKASKYMSA